VSTCLLFITKVLTGRGSGDELASGLDLFGRHPLVLFPDIQEFGQGKDAV